MLSSLLSRQVFFKLHVKFCWESILIKYIFTMKLTLIFWLIHLSNSSVQNNSSLGLSFYQYIFSRPVVIIIPPPYWYSGSSSVNWVSTREPFTIKILTTLCWRYFDKTISQRGGVLYEYIILNDWCFEYYFRKCW